MKNTIYFVVSSIPEPLRSLITEGKPIPTLETVKPDMRVWLGAEWHWTCESFLWLKQAGLNVALVEQPVEGEICIAHFDTTKNKIWAPDSFVIGIRGDRPPLHMREIELVQSPANLGGKNVFPMQLWPMAELIPRDATRGDHIERISYFGGEGGLSPSFQHSSFVNALKDMGVELNCCFDPRKWHDYHETDLCLAVRNHHHPLLLQTKPTVKLLNAWRAGCVPLLGNEPAYRAAGSCGENYFEVNHPQDVLDIVAKLKSNLTLYQSVRQAGIESYCKFNIEAVQQQWINLLEGPVAEAFAQWQKDFGKQKFARYTRRLKQFVHQWIDHKIFSVQVRSYEILGNQWRILKNNWFVG